MTDITMNYDGVFPNSAAVNVPRGLAAATIAAGGSGGSNGTGKVATWAGGNFLVNPTLTYDVVGGVMVNIAIEPGLYIGTSGAMVLPTPTYPGTAGTVTVALTYDFLFPQGASGGGGNGYWAVSADGRELDRYYRNTGNLATLDAAIPAAPLVPGITASLAAMGVVLPSLPAEAALFAEFSDSKYYNVGLTYTVFSDWVSGLSGTFSRGGTNHPYVNASGLLVQGSPNTPRFTYDPVTLQPLGLLYEPAASNMFAYSQQIAVAGSAWKFASVGTASTDNAAIGPDGTMSAGFVQETTETSLHRVIYWTSGAPVTAGSNYAYQLFLKPGGRTKIVVNPVAAMGLGVVTVDLAAKTVSNNTWRLEQWQNGWFRLWKTATATASANSSVTYNLADNSGATTYTGDGVSGIYIGGAMLEAVSSASNPPTTYIRRTGTAVATRSADALQFTIPAGVSKMTYTFGDGTTQLVAVAPGTYLIPTNLDAPEIKSLISVDLAVVGSPVTSVAGRIGDVVLAQADISGLKTTDNPSFSGISTTATTLSLGGAVFKNDTGLFQWTLGTAVRPNSWRGVIIGLTPAANAATWSNSVAIGQDAGKASTNISTAVAIGDTAGGSSPIIVGSNVIGNEAGNGPSISGSNIIGNLARCGYVGATVTRCEVVGQSAMVNNGCVDTVAIGQFAGYGINPTAGSTINQSVMIGSQVGKLSGGGTITNLILIGYNVQAPTPTTSNYISIGKVFVGDMSTGSLKVQRQDGGDATLTVAKLNLSNLPTSDPAVAGAVWRSGSDLKISLG